MTLKLYFMKCPERKISQCILPFRSCLNFLVPISYFITELYYFLTKNEAAQVFWKDQSLQKTRSFPLRISSVNVTADLFTFTEEILNEKLHFLYSEFFGKSPQEFWKNAFGEVLFKVLLQS